MQRVTIGEVIVLDERWGVSCMAVEGKEGKGDLECLPALDGRSLCCRSRLLSLLSGMFSE